VPDGSDFSLFVYGSLELPDVMRAVTGRDFRARQGILAGYRRRVIRGEVYPGIVADETERVRGIVYDGLGEHDLQVLDLFEGEPYWRAPVTVECDPGDVVNAYTYLLREHHADLLADRHWDRDLFRHRHLEAFLASCHRFRASLEEGSPVRRRIG
jgi:gamma-glutamylcyclotransferase (GGCT)/AIG2-like uncharacterized protein YtfP